MDHTVLGVGGAQVRSEQSHFEPSLEGPGVDESGDLRKLADQLQGVFIQQLFKAMRDTVPQNGGAFAQAGSEMFSGIMDEHLAEAASVQLQKGLGQAIYRQLSGNVETGSHIEIQGDPEAVGGAGEDVT